MFHVGSLEDSHSSRDSHENVLGDIDLHEDEELVECTKDVTHSAQVDPLGAVDAKQVLHRSLLVLLVDDEVSRGDSEDGNHTEYKVANEEELELLLGHFFVEVEPVLGDERQVLPVNHVVVVLEVHVEAVVDGDEDDHADELSWVNRRETVFHPERAQEESRRDCVAADAEHFVDEVQPVTAAIGQRLLLGRNAGINDDAEGEEERVLSEEQDDEDAVDVAMGELVDQ